MRIIILLFLSLLSFYSLAACTRSVIAIDVLATAILPPNLIPYNKYDYSEYVGGSGQYEVASVTTYRLSTVYSCVPAVNRLFKAKVLLPNPATVPTGEVAYKLLGANSAFAVVVKVADYNENTAFSAVNNSTGTLITDWNGPTSGVRIQVITYVLKGYNSSSVVSVTNIPVAELYLTEPSGTDMTGVNKVRIDYTLSSSGIQTKEYTCSLNQNSYSVVLDNVSVRNLNIVGQEPNPLFAKSIPLNINCPYLQNGGGREIKAYITDSLNQANTGNVLQNTVGTGYATGVGIRLSDESGNVIGLDPSQSKLINKWTFGNIKTKPDIPHTLKANYVRTSSQVTPGNVEAKALLNIVYD